MNETGLGINRGKLFVTAPFSPRHYIVAIVIGIGISWLVSSFWPLVILALIMALDAVAGVYAIARMDALRQLASYPPIHTIYEFWLELTDRFADQLNLSAEERAKLPTSPVRGGFTLEQWGQFMRWRISVVEGGRWEWGRTEGGEPRESTRDIQEIEEFDHPGITFWKIEIGNNSVVFDWDKDGLRLYAFDLRREWPIALPDGTRAPKEEHIIFSFKFPLWDKRQRLHLMTLDAGAAMLGGRRDPTSLDEFLKRTSAGRDPWRYGYRRGRDVYYSEEKDKGFQWELTRYDLRHRFRASVVKVHKKLWTREIKYVTLRLDKTGLKVEAYRWIAEPGDSKRWTPHRGESVSVVLDEELAVARLWPDSLVENFKETEDMPR